MANNPKKIQDPAELALSAIQEALGTPDKTPVGRAVDVEPAAPAVEHHAGNPSADKDLFEGVGPASSAGDDQPQARRAANDDRQSIGMILQTLQRKPPRTSYLVASIFAFAWVLGGLMLALASICPTCRRCFAGLRRHSGDVRPCRLRAGAGRCSSICSPTWSGARQELRLIAQSMAGVAMRLAEPEEVARESIVTVGQAIRREVAAMGDGVERALARAAELEALVAQ